MGTAPAADFQLDAGKVQAVIAEARQRVDTPALGAAVERAGAGEGLDPADMALLWSAPQLSSADVYGLACAARRARPARLETFSPLYLTNTCDAACRMCGMRRDNSALVRETADADGVEKQLRILGERRNWALAFVNHALRRTRALGFRHVLNNAGSFDAEEFDMLLDGMPRRAD